MLKIIIIPNGDFSIQIELSSSSYGNLIWPVNTLGKKMCKNVIFHRFLSIIRTWFLTFWHIQPLDIFQSSPIPACVTITHIFLNGFWAALTLSIWWVPLEIELDLVYIIRSAERYYHQSGWWPLKFWEEEGVFLFSLILSWIMIQFLVACAWEDSFSIKASMKLSV